jgi:hypothetical protein
MNEPRPLTIALAYYENPAMLARQVENLAALAPALAGALTLIVVDDGSPTAPAVVPKGQRFGVKVFRMKVDIRWNQDACRNLAMRHVDTEWALITDMDHVPSGDLIRRLLFGKLDTKRFYRFGRVSAPELLAYKVHPNSYALTRDLYWRAGGYDERWAGAYGTDGNFRRALDKIAAEVLLAEPLIRYPREVIADASTTQFERQSPENEILKRRIKHAIADSGDPTPVVGRFPWERVQ